MVKKDNKGVTLLELLVSLAIISFLIFAFFRVINSTKRIDIKNDRDIKVINIAQSQIEDLRIQIKSLGESDKLKIQDKDIYIKDIGKIYFKRVNYEKNIENQTYKVDVNLKKTNAGKDLYLFEIEIGVSLKDNYFSKRHTVIKTKILSNKGSIREEDEGNDVQGENYLNYCLSKAFNVFSQLPDKTLSNLISIDKIIGNKTLIDMSKEEKIDILSMMFQVEKIIRETEKNIIQTNENKYFDLLYEGKYYIKASKYTLETLNKKMDEELNESHRLNWLNTHNIFIQNYTLNIQKLHNDLWIYGLPSEYNH
ncbi:type II secretion system protein [Romboutsia lituseburensis]|uniref:type II secretion system protein n=1 Tax=Romboutsia lituseburensis TaxID=1537 RepID=UPI00215A1274|nr:type II secretion system GspH family protein [Romboutsia lituseburensis]MCR8746027.1 type II secretion system GspH family protein [Romboutsia lituseburensis]